MEIWTITPAGARLTRAIRILATATALGVGWVILGAVTSASAEEIPQDAPVATPAMSLVGTLTSTITDAESQVVAVVAATIPVVSGIAQPVHEVAAPVLEVVSIGLPISVTIAATDLPESAIPIATSAAAQVTTAAHSTIQSWVHTATMPIAMAPSLALLVPSPDSSPLDAPAHLVLFGGAGSLAAAGGASASASVALLLGAAFACALALGMARPPRNDALPLSNSLLPGTSPA